MTDNGWSVAGGLSASIRQRLDGVVDPCSSASVLPMSVIELGLVRDVTLTAGILTVHLRLTSPSCMMVAYLAKEMTERLSDLPGVTRVRVQPDEGLDWEPSMMDPVVARRRAERLALLGFPAVPVRRGADTDMVGSAQPTSLAPDHSR